MQLSPLRWNRPPSSFADVQQLERATPLEFLFQLVDGNLPGAGFTVEAFGELAKFFLEGRPGRRGIIAKAACFMLIAGPFVPVLAKRSRAESGFPGVSGYSLGARARRAPGPCTGCRLR